MKLTIKTLQQKVFQIDAEPTETVGDVKQKIAESQGHTVESQKIIYAGKVLQDSKTVESCQIKEKDFLVLMVSKPKAAPAASSSTAASSTPAAPTAPAAPAAETPAAPPAEPAPVAPPATAPVETGPVDMSSSFLSGGALEQAVNNLIEMGFERPQVLRAMRASFNNPNRAAEYLMTGIPEGLEPEQPAAAPAAQPAAQPAAPAAGDAGAAPAAQPAPVNLTGQNLFQLAQQQQQQQAAQNPLGGAGRGGLGGGNLQQLMNSPQAAQLRQMVQNNPAMLQPLIQSLAASDPVLAQTLAQNPEMLMQMLAGENMGGEGDDGEGNPIPPGATVIELTPAEREAVQRLEALGFSRQAVLEAYIVCDKNEEVTANFLFENGGDDD